MADGKVIDVKTVPDKMFAEEVMGKTVAFCYEGEKTTICSPADGTLSVLFPTGHAFGVTMENGVELLVHCGVNTVEANGEGFKILGKKQGDTVKAGDPIVEADLETLRRKYDMSVMLIVTNDNGAEVTFLDREEVHKGDIIAEVTGETGMVKKTDKNQALALQIVEAIGGRENVESVTHCMTRLRFILKDESKANDEAINAISGVIQTINAGGQKQIVIGPGVDKVYKEVCAAGGFDTADPDSGENTVKKEKLTIKGIFNYIMGAVSGSLIPILPVLIGAGIFKMVAVLFGPRNLGILAAENPVYVFCDLVNTAVYYFLPFFVAWSASKKFKCSPLYPMMLAAVMMHPTFMGIVEAGEPFKLYGLFPMPLVNYANGVIPIIISTYIISLIEKRVNKIVPDQIRVVGIPVLTMLIGFPLCLCIFGPACNLIMKYVAQGIIWLNNNAGILASVIVGSCWNFVVMFGMHVPVLMTLLPTWVEMGYDAIVTPSSIAGSMAVIGVVAAYALRAATKEKKELGWSCLITNVVGNISEPALYGIILVDKKALLYSMVSGAAGAALMFILGAKVTLFSGVGLPFLNFLRFGEYVVSGSIGMIVSIALGFAMGFIFRYEKEKA